MTGKVELTKGQRTAAIDRVGDNLALLSGAGCGKTLVLARRFVQLLMNSGDQENPLGRLVAITFTEKAAVQMQQRVWELLGRIAANNPSDRLRLLDWRNQLPEARISTIHSFCASLLRARAVEAGIDPSFTVCADDLQVQCMVTEAAETAVLEAVEGGRTDAADMLADITFDGACRLVRQLMNWRTTCNFEAYYDAEATVTRWKSALDKQARQAWAALEADAELPGALTELAECPCSNDNDRLLPVRDEFVELAGRLLKDPSARAHETFARLAGITPGALGSDKAWGTKGSAKSVRDRMKALAEAFGCYALYAEQPGELDTRAAEALATIARLAARATEIYTERKRNLGMLDFDDLLLGAADLLAKNKSIRKSLVEQIDQFLIDECQDTDSLQISLIDRLVRPDDGSAQPPAGRIFLVGDAKQSIYRFRGAQVEVFNDMCRRLGEKNSETLDVSFRTHEAGIAFINHLFGPLMGDRYAPIRPHRDQSPPAESVEILLASGAEGSTIANAAEATAAQAAVTAQRIRQMLDEGEKLVWDRAAQRWRAAQPRDIAILLARMTYSLEYERELAARDIPYYVVAGAGFFRQQEVFDVLNALRVIDNPFDDVALFGLLRSSMFGLDDNSLMHIACACDPPYLAAVAEADLSGKLDPAQLSSLTSAVEVLRQLHRRKDAVGIDALIDDLLEATGYESALLCRGLRPAGNLRLLTDRARAAAATGMALADFIAQSEELILNESRYEQAAVAGEGQNVARLMTIHKAKGLEFPVVFVPDLNAGRRGDSGPLLSRADMGLTYRLGTRQDEAGRPNQPLSFRLAERLELDDRHAEDIRKLYVAATRHMDHLVFVGADWRNSEGQILSTSSYLAQMDRVLAVTRAVDEGRNAIGYGDRFNALVHRVAPAKGARWAARASPGRKALAEASGPTDLAARIHKLAKPGQRPVLLGPLRPDQGQVEIAVTALCDFDRCPMLYRWRHELRVPAALLEPDTSKSTSAAAGSAGESNAGAIDSATMGTLLHRCMELLDFGRPQRADGLVRRAAAEMNLEELIDTGMVATDLADMIESFAATSLWSQIARADRMLRELDFVLECGPAVLRGQIDLLYRTGDVWRIVDYKSDHVQSDQAAEHAERYWLQMLAYSAAATRHLGAGAVEARLYFLRPAAIVTVTVEADALKSAQARIADIASCLITARREGNFQKADSKLCGYCRYAALCGR